MRAVCFDLDLDVFHRYGYAFIRFFSVCGYQVYIEERAKKVTNRFAKLVFEIENVHVTSTLPREAAFHFSDRAPADSAAIHVSADYFADCVAGSFRVPMAMHPMRYHLGLDASEVEWGGCGPAILFAGNLTDPLYISGELEKKFNIINRVRLVEMLVRHCGDRVFFPKTKEEISGERSICIVSGKEGANIPFKAFREVLARFSFFLAGPGWAMPLCHNVVEAMSVGTIPILQYPTLFTPALTHGVDCIAFRGRDDLPDRMEEVLVMSEAEIRRMRANVLRYFERYLSPQAVVDRLEAQRASLRTVYLNAERRSANLLKKKWSADG